MKSNVFSLYFERELTNKEAEGFAKLQRLHDKRDHTSPELLKVLAHYDYLKIVGDNNG